MDNGGCAGDTHATCSLGNGNNLRTCTCGAGYSGTDASLTDTDSFAGCTEIVASGNSPSPDSNDESSPSPQSIAGTSPSPQASVSGGGPSPQSSQSLPD